MNRKIIFVPQYPTPMRYQQWWLWKIPIKFEKAGFDVHVLGKDKIDEMHHRRDCIITNQAMFSPIHAAIELECAQMEEYMSLKIDKSDILFLADISFPGLFSNVLFHKKPDKLFAFCHATSMNFKDYFAKDRDLKFLIEMTHSQLFDKIFIGSEYHKEKLGWDNTVVTYLPFHPFFSYINTKVHDIVSASRPTPQKVCADTERRVEAAFSKIVRKSTGSWEEYFTFLSESKILLITSYEDTFGYQIVDAIMNGCVPIAPNRCAYPELLPKEYLYNNDDELFTLIDLVLEGKLKVPKLLCEDQMNNFYNKIINEMIKEVKDYPF